MKKFKKLQAVIDEMLEICRGMALPFSFFFETKTGIKDLYPFAERLIKYLPEDVSEEYKLLYLHFFISSTAYIMGTCGESDQVLLSFNKMAPIFFKINGDQTVYEIMLERANGQVTTKPEMQFFDICKEEHTKFKELCSENITMDDFAKNVSNTIDRFLKEEKLYIRDDIFDNSYVDIGLTTMLHQLRYDVSSTLKELYDR